MVFTIFEASLASYVFPIQNSALEIMDNIILLQKKTAQDMCTMAKIIYCSVYQFSKSFHVKPTVAVGVAAAVAATLVAIPAFKNPIASFESFPSLAAIKLSCTSNA